MIEEKKLFIQKFMVKHSVVPTSSTSIRGLYDRKLFTTYYTQLRKVIQVRNPNVENVYTFEPFSNTSVNLRMILDYDNKLVYITNETKSTDDMRKVSILIFKINEDTMSLYEDEEDLVDILLFLKIM